MTTHHDNPNIQTTPEQIARVMRRIDALVGSLMMSMDCDLNTQMGLDPKYGEVYDRCEVIGGRARSAADYASRIQLDATGEPLPSALLDFDGVQPDAPSPTADAVPVFSYEPALAALKNLLTETRQAIQAVREARDTENDDTRLNAHYACEDLRDFLASKTFRDAIDL